MYVPATEKEILDRGSLLASGVEFSLKWESDGWCWVCGVNRTLGDGSRGRLKLLKIYLDMSVIAEPFSLVKLYCFKQKRG